ncbi:MAG: response regulator transcription factor [Candidatus Eisenbacteria bacterium]|nr:response regulator transcription factor [Candidatus Eisenbacteria bacterium]
MLRVLLADDHHLFRDGLRALIRVTPGFSVIGEAADGLEALRLCHELRPNLILLDISMPGLNGLEATRRIRAEVPETRILILSMHADRRFVAETLRAGASGYLLKDSPFPDVVRAMHAAMEGHVFLSPAITDVVAQDFAVRGEPAATSVFQKLSAREREVLQLLAEGRGTKEIAAHLSVSGKTIETHRRQIMEKLDLHSVAELTKYAIREGLTPLE